jgi:purine-binding chemotaxis protein CheW
MTMLNDNSPDGDGARGDHRQFVTVSVGDQLFGLPILQVRDVFVVTEMTPIPLAPTSVAGLFNLRGRVVTVLSLRTMLGFEVEAKAGDELIAIGIEWRGESFGLLVDRVHEVMALATASRDSNPINLDKRWSSLSAGVHRLDSQLLVELSLESLFNDLSNKAA